MSPAKHFLVAFFVAGAVAAPAAQGRGTASAEWPQFRGSPALTGTSATPTPATPKVLWSLELGDMVDSSPAISGGVAYIGTQSGLLVAVDMASGKARILGKAHGFVKIVREKKYDQILGVHIIGPHATDLIAEACVALRLESTAEELYRTIHAHPTLSEVVMEAAHASHGSPIHA